MAIPRVRYDKVNTYIMTTIVITCVMILGTICSITVSYKKPHMWNVALLGTLVTTHLFHLSCLLMYVGFGFMSERTDGTPMREYVLKCLKVSVLMVIDLVIMYYIQLGTTDVVFYTYKDEDTIESNNGFVYSKINGYISLYGYILIFFLVHGTEMGLHVEYMSRSTVPCDLTVWRWSFLFPYLISRISNTFVSLTVLFTTPSYKTNVAFIPVLVSLSITQIVISVVRSVFLIRH